MRKRYVLIAILLTGAIVCAAPIFNSFNSGALSPLLKYRVEIEKRSMGVEKLENFVTKQQGTAFRRPGTEFIREVNDSNFMARMIPFEYSTSDSYLLVFNKNTIGFFKTVD